MSVSPLDDEIWDLLLMMGRRMGKNRITVEMRGTPLLGAYLHDPLTIIYEGRGRDFFIRIHSNRLSWLSLHDDSYKSYRNHTVLTRHVVRAILRFIKHYKQVQVDIKFWRQRNFIFHDHFFFLLIVIIKIIIIIIVRYITQFKFFREIIRGEVPSPPTAAVRWWWC